MTATTIEFDLPDSVKSLLFTIRGKCTEVFNILQKGYAESIYQRALGVEFQEEHIAYDLEVNMPIQYKGHEIGVIRADIVIRGSCPLIIETKATYYPIRPEDRWQLIRYLRQKKMDYGILVNFPQIIGISSPFFEVLIEHEGQFYNVDLDDSIGVLIR